MRRLFINPSTPGMRSITGNILKALPGQASRVEGCLPTFTKIQWIWILFRGKYMRVSRILSLGAFWLSMATGQSLQAPVGYDAVWQPCIHFIQAMHQQCHDLAFPALGKCFVEQMASSNASPAAVRFAHRIDNQGFLRDFRETGRVDIAYAEYVFAANENQHVLLVNGTPSIVDVDDLNLLDQKQLMGSAVYRSLRDKYPKIALWPGDRNTTRYPVARSLSGGGLHFIVRYRLQNFCHACKVIGSAEFAFDFDRNGRFLGTWLVSVHQNVAQGD